jgi:hypothetical protein
MREVMKSALALSAIVLFSLTAQIRAGNTHRLARPEFDRGQAPGGLRLERMLLVLERSTEQQRQLDELLAQQQTAGSPRYHHWLSPQEFGERFGPSDDGIRQVTGWLESNGLEIGEIAAGRGAIEFSGTAADVERAFRTSIHQYVVEGQEHWANAADPVVPQELRGLTAGVATLHNFLSRPLSIRSRAHPDYSLGWYYDALAPADFAVIYHANQLYLAGVNGVGSLIAVIGRSNMQVSDVAEFRDAFGLPYNPPLIVLNGADPTDLGGAEEQEAVLDNSWAGAVAPYAQVRFVISASTAATDGALLSEVYVVNHNNTLYADVMTESFGVCEADVTSAQAALISSLAEQAAAEGITYVVAAGDSGTAGCDAQSETVAAGPLSVNAYASSPYITAVGGTQFNEMAGQGPYWAETSISAYYLSVLSYIPEDVWNWSCATSSCNGRQPNILAGGGGASAVFPKPAWQTGVAGIPADGARDLPDVSLAASAEHDPYLICIDGGCSRSTPGFTGVGGTSAAAPAFAGIMAMVRQRTGARQGAANSVLYQLAAAEPWTNCNASAAVPPASCIFNDVTSGSNSVPGEPGYGTARAEYQAAAGYDLATGLGSVNAFNLVEHWPAGYTPAVTLSAYGLTFPNQAVGVAGSPQTITLTNTGTAELWISDITLTGDNPSWFQLNRACGSVVDASASCPLSIAFLPAAAGAVTATLMIIDDAPSSPQMVKLSGTGTGTAVAFLQPVSLAFSTQLVNTSSAAQPLTLTNTGNSALTITNISIAGANGNQFLETNTCFGSVKAGASCTISVIFRPTSSGNKSASLQITDNTAGSPQTVSLTGAAAAASLNVSPVGLSFRSQVVGSASAPQTVKLTSTGGSAASLSKIALAGADASDFQETSTCPASLSTGASCTLSVVFKPLAAGMRTASVVLSDNASGSPPSIALAGTAVEPVVKLSPANLTFPAQPAGSSSSAQTVTLTNTGTAALAIAGIAIAGTNASQFQQTNTCPASLAPAAHCTISVVFKPAVAGALSAAITVSDNAPGSPQSVALAGGQK